MGVGIKNPAEAGYTGVLAVRAILVAHVPRGEEVTRIISMRKANRREQKIYQERLGEG
jgi:uncharacterized DUF497 family protein